MIHTTNEEIRQDLGGYNLLGARGSASASFAPPTEGQKAQKPLLYLNDHNSDKSKQGEGGTSAKNGGKRPSSSCAKKMYVLTKNVNGFAKEYGIENMGLLTLTFKDNVRCKKEAGRRWDNLRRTIAREKPFKVLNITKEKQLRGAWHFHILVNMGIDIRTGFDWESFDKAGEAQKKGDWQERQKYTRRYAKKAHPVLNETWKWLRKKCSTHGFGRSELMPIKYPNNIGSYLGKYLLKEEQNREKYMRDHGKKAPKFKQTTYARDVKRKANAQFSWVKHPQGRPTFRHMLKQWAEYRGFTSVDHIRAHYGKRWSFHCYGEIMYDYVRIRRDREGLPALKELGWDRFKLNEKQITQGLNEYFKQRGSPGNSDRFKVEEKRFKAWKVNQNAWWHK